MQRSEVFLVAAPTPDRPVVQRLAHLHQACRAYRPLGVLEVAASVGVATLEFAEDPPELTLKRADQALYCASDGGNRVLADAAQRQGRGFARITLDGIRMLNVPVKGSTNLRRHLSA